MASGRWRTDWLYQLIFDEVARIWTRAIRESTSAIMGPPPDFLLIRECGDADWERVLCRPPILREWTYRGTAFELRASSDAEPLPPLTQQDAFYNYGDVRFHIRPDRKKVVFEYVLGPLYGRGIVHRVVGQGRRGKMRGWLAGDPDSMSWIS
jgi:hypothetical protein